MLTYRDMIEAVKRLPRVRRVACAFAHPADRDALLTMDGIRLPDGWTEPHADSHRYRMLGNGVVVNVAEWIGRRIAQCT